jgi:hypothetical protein
MTEIGPGADRPLLCAAIRVHGEESVRLLLTLHQIDRMNLIWDVEFLQRHDAL